MRKIGDEKEGAKSVLFLTDSTKRNAGIDIVAQRY